MSAATSTLAIQLLTPSAIVPTRGSAQAAGLDLYAPNDFEIPAKGQQLIPLQIAIAVPVGCYGRIAPRSSLASKLAVTVDAGVIDSDYRGEVMVLLVNRNDGVFKGSRGDRIAQLIIEKIQIPTLEVVASLSDTVRGKGGFGSTGV